MLRSLAAALCLIGTSSLAATCGNDGSGFAKWKQDFSAQAQAAGVGSRGLAALSSAQYATQTIAADRNQRSFRYALDDFLRIRGADTIVRLGRQRIAANPAYYESLERIFGVPAAVIVAIHGMETGFGNNMGNANVVSAITTLAYDCRRSDFFAPHAIAALKLVDTGGLSASTKGAMHGEVGHTQFLPGNVVQYGVDADANGVVDLTNISDSLASTANFLKQKGWRSGQGYQEGQPNFKVIQEWNAAGVYQKAIALMAARIES